MKWYRVEWEVKKNRQIVQRCMILQAKNCEDAGGKAKADWEARFPEGEAPHRFNVRVHVHY